MHELHLHDRVLLLLRHPRSTPPTTQRLHVQPQPNNFKQLRRKLQPPLQRLLHPQHHPTLLRGNHRRLPRCTHLHPPLRNPHTPRPDRIRHRRHTQIMGNHAPRSNYLRVGRGEPFRCHVDPQLPMVSGEGARLVLWD